MMIVKEEAVKDRNIISRKEAMDILKISSSTIWRWSREDKIQSYRIGQRVYFLYDELVDSLKREGGYDASNR